MGSVLLGAMDANQCRVLYIDDRFPSERWLSRNSIASGHESNLSNRGLLLPVELQTNVDAILQVFSQVYVCNTGRAFSTKLAEFSDTIGDDYSPVLALFDIAPEFRHELSITRGRRASGDDLGAVPHALHRSFTFTSESDESYGLQLLARIASDLQVADYGKLIIPIAITRSKNGTDSLLETHTEEGPEPDDFLKPNDRTLSGGSRPLSLTSSQKRLGTRDSQDAQLLLKCLDAGAVDVVIDHLDQTRVLSLVGHSYKAWKAAKKAESSFLSTKKTRRQSWVGMDDQKPYAYLREAMVRKLMNRICDPESYVEENQYPELNIEDARKSEIASAVGEWGFCAHDFTEEELVYGACCMLQHATEMPQLEKWRLSFDELIIFVQAARAAYNSFVIYHNFRHAIDVLQACFYFLIENGALPVYPRGDEPERFRTPRAPIAELIKPFDALTLLISAIGHDVGHPGVNNLFLVKLNAPLAQLYNDKSVLEAFHCAAFSQILRQHWASAFEDKELRRLLISNILATDMGIHSDYIQQMGDLQSKIGGTKTTDGWAPKDLEHCRILVCGLLIKCADISNIARPWTVAKKWTHLLQDEFHHQGEMEKEVGMDSCLFGGPPELNNLEKLANGQMGFMTLFGIPLFGGVADFLPGMCFGEATIQSNKKIWFDMAEQEKRKKSLIVEAPPAENLVSPRSQSPKTIRRKHASDSMGGEPSSYFPSSLQNVTDQSSPEDSPGVQPAENATTAAVKEAGHGLSPSEIRAADRFAQMVDASGPRSGPLKPRKSSQAIPAGQLHIHTALDGGSTPPRNHTQLAVPDAAKDQKKLRPKSSPANPETPAIIHSSEADLKWHREPPLPIKLSLPHRSSGQRTPVTEDSNLNSRRHQQSGSFGADKCSKHTTSTVMTPTSTQATSFLTEGSENGKALESFRGDTTTETTMSSSGRDSEKLDLGNLNVLEKHDKKAAKSPKKEKKMKKGFHTTITDPREEPEDASSGAHLTLPPIPDDVVNVEHSPLPRKKSRIRLAFWKKNKNPDAKSSEAKNSENKQMEGEGMGESIEVKDRPDSGVDQI